MADLKGHLRTTERKKQPSGRAGRLGWSFEKTRSFGVSAERWFARGLESDRGAGEPNQMEGCESALTDQCC